MTETQAPLIIDIEASGYDDDSYPIEIGVVLDDEVRYCSLIKPSKNWTHWDQAAEQSHRISRIALQTSGRSAATVAKQLNELLAGRTVYSDGWTTSKPSLTRLFEAARTPMKFSISSLDELLSKHQVTIWRSTKDQVAKEIDNRRHRASNVAAITQETYLRTLALTTAVA